jgi:hypothetical protein
LFVVPELHELQVRIVVRPGPCRRTAAAELSEALGGALAGTSWSMTGCRPRRFFRIRVAALPFASAGDAGGDADAKGR